MNFADSLNMDVRKMARRLGELGEKIENLHINEEMQKFEARILDGIQNCMNSFENRIENRMNSFQTSIQDLISLTMESYFGKLDISSSSH